MEAYVARAETETEIERLSTDREKTGVSIGADAINPVNGERIPIFVADYVLAGYGTGAIMAVRARRARLRVRPEVRACDPPCRCAAGRRGRRSRRAVAHSADEVLINSGEFSGLAADEGGRRIVASLEQRGKGRAAVTYRLQLADRPQRYWGTRSP